MLVALANMVDQVAGIDEVMKAMNKDAKFFSNCTIGRRIIF